MKTKYTLEQIDGKDIAVTLRLLNAYAEEVKRLKVYEDMFDALETAFKSKELWLISAMFTEQDKFSQFVVLGKRTCFTSTLEYPLRDIIEDTQKKETS